MDHRDLEKKWQAIWNEQKAFQPEVKPGQKKFMGTFPYPYVNGLPHVGHLFTMMRLEAFSRYKRAQGYNTLFPQAWHCTGQPIVNAAQRVAAGDEKQIKILRDFGVAQDEIPLFKDPLHWIAYFVPGYRSDVQSLGMSIDWRREFITTSLNPRYDKFIRWQFKQLKEKGYVALGKHPIVWCPKELAAVSDHGRLSGEGETPQEFVLIPFKLTDNDEYIAVATLRPETIDGLTNIWVNPAIEYVHATVDKQRWIVSRECAAKLAEQEHDVHVHEPISGKLLIGKTATGPSGTVPLLPASFPTADKGSGIVMSVPSDSPDDYIALRDLQQNKKLLEEYKLHISDIKPIPIIDGGELGHTPAVKVVEDMKIANQKERDKLEAAKKLVYKKGYYEGVMLAGEYKGEKVEAAKEKIKEALLATKQAYKFYELTGPVVCRCLTPCVVKIVSNQWFITYSNPEWKAATHKALDQMTLYPDKSRQQFHYVIDWLNDWACTRAEGLGTRLPWDEHWLIESLSDSTLYNAFYTITHKLNDVPETRITDELFDFVFLGKGTAKEPFWNDLRSEFDYWYPVDFRNSGKDLIQNHLTFMLFTHTALLPEEKWPKGYGLNGWVTVDGQKMSKSLGNLIPVRAMVELYGADAARLTILNGGEGMDDPNWDTELAKTTKQRLANFLELIQSHYNEGRDTHQPLDDWFASKLNSTIKATTEAMERTNFRTALQHCWFDLANTMKQYIKLTNGDVHRNLFSHALEAQVKMLQPFAPHTAEEGWHFMGKKTLVSLDHWPTYDEHKINAALESRQEMIELLAADIRNVAHLLKLEKVKEVTIIIAAKWKYDFAQAMKEQLEVSRNVGEVLKAVLPQFKEHGQDVTKLVPAIAKDPAKLPVGRLTQEEELRSIEAAAEYLQKAFGAEINFITAENSAEKKAGVAFPGKPAILLS
jgi:leucyl-tRNA synthetase